VRGGSDALDDDVTDGGGPHEEAVVVVMDAGVVFVECADEFGGVAGKEKVLDVEVAEDDLLIAACESVEPAVGIFLEQVEVGGVVFETIAAKIAKNANGGLFVYEYEATKIGVELLNSGTHGNKIVIGAEVVKFYFDKGFLQADVAIEASGARANVGADYTEFANVEVVEADFRGDADAPVDRLEGCVAMKKIEGEAEGLIEKKLLAIAEEGGTAGLSGACGGGSRNATAVDIGFGRSGEIEEDLLPEELRPNGKITFKAVAIERIVPARFGVNVLARSWVTAIVRFF